MTPTFPVHEVRRAILSALPQTAVQFGSAAPEPRFVYVPAAHARALNPDNMLVVGIRGAGKSLWWSALQSPQHRKLLGDIRGGIKESTEVSAGFGTEPDISKYPDRDTLQLLGASYRPRIIWRTVAAHHMLGARTPLREFANWADRVEWVQSHPEEIAAAFDAADKELRASGTKHLILFDALDKAADNWTELKRLLRGLLEVLLDFRSFRALRAKAFVRPDMLEDPEVAAFPDASKVISGKVDLDWPKHELFGLLWQYLGNAPEGGAAFRVGSERLLRIEWDEVDRVWQMPEGMRQDEAAQRRVFDAIAGKWMGTDRRRGFPYTWLPGHLADARNQTSPRSFLAAVRAAAVDSESSYRDYRYALHYEAIKRGVQEASRIRVREVAEDFPWVEIAMRPLAGLVIPCELEQLIEKWNRARALRTIGAQPKKPRRIDDGFLGIAQDLRELSILQFMADGRVNMPDVYRVGFGLGRKGGVKPIK